MRQPVGQAHAREHGAGVAVKLTRLRANDFPGACPPGTVYGAGSPTGNVFIEDDTLGLAGTYLVACMVRKEIMACTPQAAASAINMGPHRPFISLKKEEKGQFFLPTDVVLGTRYSKNPIHLKIPVTIAGMSFGALSANAKEALGRGATIAGTSTTTGDGGMTPEERGQSQHLVYQYLPSRYGMNPDDLRKADAIEIVLGQGAKPGGGGMLLGMKVTERVAGMRTLPIGVDQRSACRHPDWTGPDDLAIKIAELREITDWEKPIYVKIGASRPYYDVKLAVKAGADVIVLDGMQGGTAATQEVFIEHVGIPILPAIPQAVQALQEMGMHRKVQLIVSGGIRNGADVAKAMALGADAVAIGTAALIALGDNHPRLDEELKKIGSAAGFYDDWQNGRDPAGITTQDPELSKRLDPVEGGAGALQRLDAGAAYQPHGEQY